jgi:hypothetical protein
VEEFAGRDESLLGVLPAEEGLKAYEFALGDAEDGLVEDAELLSV